MIKISLCQVRLFGHHGIHSQEKDAGGEFEVSMDVFYQPAQKISSIDQTIDYTMLYEIVKKRMQQPSALLETIVQDIEMSVRERFPFAGQINITISKIHPPLINFRGQLSVSLINH